jgi:hypothetical protein
LSQKKEEEEEEEEGKTGNGKHFHNDTSFSLLTKSDGN